MIVPVILSGGAGTRLWPLSRELYPKQLLPLVNERTMLQDTILRLQGVAKLTDPLVVCNESHRFLVAEQLRQVGIAPEAIILEPVGRNTAPAVAVAALQALAKDEDAVLLVLPADHAVADAAALRAAVEAGREWAEAGTLITFGIVPDKPETGYGYIKAGARLEELFKVQGSRFKVRQFKIQNSKFKISSAFSVASFVEKPDLETARGYVDSGDYFWNSGMFMFRASVYLQELERLAPEMLAACRRAVAGAGRDLDFTRLDAAAFAACPADSIDYAVMEKTAAAAVIPLDAGWNDVGSWSALWEVGKRSPDGNVTVGRRADARGEELLRLRRQPAGGGDRRRGPGHRRDRRRGAGRQQGPGAGGQGDCCPAQGAEPPRGVAASEGLSPLGELRVPGERRPLPGEEHHRQTGRHPFPADAPPPGRALDRRPRHRPHHPRRRDASCSAKTSPPISLSAPPTGWKTREKSPWS